MWLHGVLSFGEGVVLLMVALLPWATWQRTRRAGWAWLAAGFGLWGAVTLGYLVLPRFVAGSSDAYMTAALGLRAFGLLPTALVAVGLWQLYRDAKARAA